MAVERVVRADRVEVVDAEGRVRVVLGMLVDNVFGMALLDALGRERAWLLVDDAGGVEMTT
jgi:hypothetical protein